MSALLKAFSVAALVSAGVVVANRPTIDASWTPAGFARQLRWAAERAEGDLRGAPDIAGARVRVSSPDDHAPLRVEAAIDWACETVSEDRMAEALAAVRSRFESFACVDVVALKR